MARPFRFGVNPTAVSGRPRWADTCRRAEQLGYDVILVNAANKRSRTAYDH
ncbi:hypothetical protein ACFQE5_07475 [Pseudonocardia hispaniensis]|uniref:Sugar phosphate isomerase/epimerase n=1 Tax=Pseudonocardia hispaniensis TaxID=904933 RepID=A0ABW1J066_9PSEU